MPAGKVRDNKDKKPVRIPEHLAAPHNPMNIRLSKADFVKQEKERMEREAKVREYRRSLEAEAEKKVEKKEEEIKVAQKPEPKAEIKEEKQSKPRGRPKKIE